MVETGENRAEKLLGLHAKKQKLEELEKEYEALLTIHKGLEKNKNQESQIGE